MAGVNQGGRGRVTASIEINPKQAVDNDNLAGLFPVGTSVYVTDVGTDPSDRLVEAAQRLINWGYAPVPHFPARRLPSKDELRSRIERFSAIGVRNALVIAGGSDVPAGPFKSSMDVLELGWFEEAGFRQLGVAGHPEGSPDFSESEAMAALAWKNDYARNSSIDLRIVTQFGFDAPGFIRWAEKIAAEGNVLPIHLGVAGPAKLTTLVKFAAMCGVGPSLEFLKRKASAITTLLTGFDPEEVVKPLEQHILASGGKPIEQVHVFAFGGLKTTSEWLRDRGSWPARFPEALSA